MEVNTSYFFYSIRGKSQFDRFCTSRSGFLYYLDLKYVLLPGMFFKHSTSTNKILNNLSINLFKKNLISFVGDNFPVNPVHIETPIGGVKKIRFQARIRFYPFANMLSNNIYDKMITTIVLFPIQIFLILSTPIYWQKSICLV